jgi:hypothetical protein
VVLNINKRGALFMFNGLNINNKCSLLMFNPLNINNGVHYYCLGGRNAS